MYEAEARVADPVHGCTGVINNLQKKLEQAQLQLASAEAKLANISAQESNFLTSKSRHVISVGKLIYCNFISLIF